MPRLQKLNEKYKGRPDVQLLTLNADENPGMAEAFMQKSKLTLPVLRASAYVQDTLRVFAFPNTWVVDADGVVRAKILGFSGSDKWEEWMADLIEKIGPGAGAAGAARAQDP